VAFLYHLVASISSLARAFLWRLAPLGAGVIQIVYRRRRRSLPAK